MAQLTYSQMSCGKGRLEWQHLSWRVANFAHALVGRNENDRICNVEVATAGFAGFTGFTAFTFFKKQPGGQAEEYRPDPGIATCWRILPDTSRFFYPIELRS